MFFKERKIVKDLIVRAGRGQAEAEFELAKRHMSGKGVKQDIIKALELYEDSAKHGSVPAQLALGELYFNGVEELFTDKRIDRDYEKAAYYYEKAVENGAEVTEDICMQLGEIYRFGGYGIAEDAKKSAFWYLNPAKQGNTDAQSALAGCYFVLEDKQNALLWAGKAAEGGGKDEMCSLGAMYFDYKDYANALIWYGKAADLNDDFALYGLGEMYLNGYGVKADREKAKEYWLKAAEYGNTEAKDRLKTYFHEAVE